MIVFSSNTEMRLLLNAAKRQQVAHFIWLGSDGWSGNMEISQENEEYLEGALTVQPASSVIPGKNAQF